MKKHILEISGIQKCFNDKIILSDIYLKIQTGDIVGLLGRNGSGKSTLFKIVFGILPAAAKSIFINGISKNNSCLLNEISYLHQEQFIPNHLSVIQTISLSVAKQKVTFFCEDDFLKSILNRKIKYLSVGELRYLQVKLVLFNDSNFVLLDEPFSGLSPKMSEVIMQLIKENSESKGVFITDHDYEKVIKIATEVLMLKDGKLHQVNDKAGFSNKDYL